MQQQLSSLCDKDQDVSDDDEDHDQDHRHNDRGEVFNERKCKNQPLDPRLVAAVDTNTQRDDDSDDDNSGSIYHALRPDL